MFFPLPLTFDIVTLARISLPSPVNLPPNVGSEPVLPLGLRLLPLLCAVLTAVVFLLSDLLLEP